MDTSPPFKTFLEPQVNRDGKFYYPRLDIPVDIAEAMLGEKNMVRVIIHFDNGKRLHRALKRSKNGETFITLGKTTLKDAGQEPGTEIEIWLEIDKTEFGFEVPEEFEEVMRQDPEGRQAFLALKPGLRRSFLHYLGSAKTVETRIQRSLRIIENLKMGIISAGDPSRARNRES